MTLDVFLMVFSCVSADYLELLYVSLFFPMGSLEKRQEKC